MVGSQNYLDLYFMISSDLLNFNIFLNVLKVFRSVFFRNARLYALKFVPDREFLVVSFDMSLEYYPVFV